MKRRRSKLSAILLLGLGLTGLQAQEAIPASGGDASGSGGSVSYSVGQMVYAINTGTNGSEAQGVQQPYEISIIIGIEGADGINLLVSVQPNPTSDILLLKVDASTTLSTRSLNYQLFDMLGNLIETNKITNNETSIIMRDFVPATYLLKVYAIGGNEHISAIPNDRIVKSFKIIKN